MVSRKEPVCLFVCLFVWETATLGRPLNRPPWGGRLCLPSCLLHDPNATRACRMGNIEPAFDWLITNAVTF